MSLFDFIPSLSAGLSLSSGVGNYFADRKAKKSYEDYVNKTREAARENFNYQVRALQNRFDQEKEASLYNLQNNQIANMKAKATAQASAASGGVSGSTLDNLFNDYDRAAAQSSYIAKRNLQLKGFQLIDNIDAARISALNTINNIQQYSSTGWGSLFSGLGNALTAYSSAQTTADQRRFYKRLGLGL